MALKLRVDTEASSTSSKKAARAGAMGLVSTERSMNWEGWVGKEGKRTQTRG
jgi:hypothetical protein